MDKTKNIKSGVPGQMPLIQFWEAISFNPPFTSVLDKKSSFKTQFEPPYCGEGLSHILILEYLPSPQDVEHVLQSLQAPQLPSTNVQIY